MEAAKQLEAQAKKQAEELQQEKTALELEASDLRRQCADLQQKASTLSVRSPYPSLLQLPSLLYYLVLQQKAYTLEVKRNLDLRIFHSCIF